MASHHIKLNHGFKSDLMWWKVFSTYWNGASLLVDPYATPQVVLTPCLGVMGLWGLVQVHMVSATVGQFLRVQTDH